MKLRYDTVLLWTLATVLMLSLAVYQRMTGPTHPARVKATFGSETYKLKLLRSNSTNQDAIINLVIPDTAVKGICSYKRLGTNDSLTKILFTRSGDTLVAKLPKQPPAGKLEYTVQLLKGSDIVNLTNEKVEIRFKGDVPAYILIPHIFFMFFAMLFSIRTGIEALVKGISIVKLSRLTLLFLTIGGLILGPIVQHYAFGEYWTGIPFGYDLTDNKTLIAFIFWVIAVVMLKRNQKLRIWVIIASIIMLAVYMIPHSKYGSKLDYSSGQIKTGK